MLAFSGIENMPIDNVAMASDNKANSVEEGSLVLPDGTKLYTKTWKTKEKPRAIIAFYHGFSDHSNSWFQFFPTLASSGFEVHALDQRGWGQSSASDRKLRGDFGTTDVVMADLHFFLQSVVPFTQEGSIPLFLMGHSMGGMNVLYYSLNPESPYYTAQSSTPATPTSQVKLSGVVSIAPLVAVHPTTQPPKIVELLGRVAVKVLPKVTMVQAIDAKWVSRDPVVVESIRKDAVLSHKTGTLEALNAMLGRGAWLDALHKNPHSIAAEDNIPPIWVGHGTADKITWFDATKRLMDNLKIKDKTFKVYEDAYHKLTNDTEEVVEEVTGHIVTWIEEKLPQGAVEGSTGEAQ
ncbi:putative alpha/beta hydrolase [Talaromyces proteolyticus]|uniref:Alpha/beta hydrolase n=1 Tax=Talaromyces proteolyticus TaxID=1131652 RepID=A0AAD4KRN1_9EURO|nr:putative alpha/beta hydrolase [Talaromyces proteolyticus]KAH8697745.1 putative alpha/beta hydrolase [Talaromyces proteolyticus]